MLFLAVRGSHAFPVAVVGDVVIPKNPFPEDGEYQVIYHAKDGTTHCVGTFSVQDFDCGRLQENEERAHQTLQDVVRNAAGEIRALMRRGAWQNAHSDHVASWFVVVGSMVEMLSEEIAPLITELLVAPDYIQAQHGYEDDDAIRDDIDAIERLAAEWRATFS